MQIQIHKLKGVSNKVKKNLKLFFFVWNGKKLIVAKWSQGSIINISYKKWRTFFRQRKNTNLSNYWHLRRYIDITCEQFCLTHIIIIYLFNSYWAFLTLLWSLMLMGCSHIVPWMAWLQYCYRYWINFLRGMISTWKIIFIFNAKMYTISTFSIN